MLNYQRVFILAYQYRYYERCLTIGGKDFSETLRAFDKNKTNKTIQNSWTVLHAASGEQFWSHRQLLNSKSVPTSAAEISRHVPPMFPAVRGALEELSNKHIETRSKKYGPQKNDSELFFDIFCFSTFFWQRKGAGGNHWRTKRCAHTRAWPWDTPRFPEGMIVWRHLQGTQLRK